MEGVGGGVTYVVCFICWVDKVLNKFCYYIHPVFNFKMYNINFVIDHDLVEQWEQYHVFH